MDGLGYRSNFATYYVYNNDLLSLEDKSLLEKFVKVVRPFSEMPSLMVEYTNQLSVNLQSLDISNLRKVTTFIANTFCNG